jgi:hypothetical protein
MTAGFEDRNGACAPAAGAHGAGHRFDPAPLIDAAGLAAREAALARGLALVILAMPDAPRLTCGDPDGLGAALSLALAETIAVADPGTLALRLVGDGHGGRIAISTRPYGLARAQPGRAPRLDTSRSIARAAGAELLVAGRAGLGFTVQLVLPAAGLAPAAETGASFAGARARLALAPGAAASGLGDWLRGLGFALADTKAAEAADLVICEADAGAPSGGGLVVALDGTGAGEPAWADMVLAPPLTIADLDRIRAALTLRRASRREASARDLFDLATLRRLRRATEAGNGGFVAGLMRLYRLQAPAALERAGETILRRDAALAAEALVALESMSRDIGAGAVAAAAVDLARAFGRGEAGPAGLARIERLLAATLRRLPAELGLALDAAGPISLPRARLN